MPEHADAARAGNRDRGAQPPSDTAWKRMVARQRRIGREAARQEEAGLQLTFGVEANTATSSPDGRRAVPRPPGEGDDAVAPATTGSEHGVS